MAKSSRFILVIDADGKPARQEISKLTDSVKEADNEAKAFGKGGQLDGLISDLGDVDVSAKGIVGSLAGPGGGAAAALGLAGGLVVAAKAATDAAIEVDVLATALNTDVETASRLATVFERVGIETNDIADIGLQISGALSDDVELAQKLGLTLGQAKDPVTALKAGIDNWDFIDATTRASLFGEEGVRQISAIIAEGGNLTDLLNEVDDANVISADDVREARELNNEIKALEEEFKGLALTVGQEVIPYVVDLAGKIRDLDPRKDAGTSLVGWGKLIYKPFMVGFDALVDGAENAKDALTDTGDEIDEVVKKVEEIGPASKRSLDASAQRWTAMGATAKAEIDKIDAELAASRNGALADWKNGLNIETETAELQRLIRQAMGGSAEDIHAAERATIDWLEKLEEVDEAAIIDIRTAFNEEDLKKVNADVIKLTQKLKIPLVIDYQGLEFSNPGYTGPGDPAFWSAPAPAATNLTVNMPRSATPRSVGQQVDQWRRVNG